MPWENTEKTIRSGHRAPQEFQTVSALGHMHDTIVQAASRHMLNRYTTLGAC
jgi:hypothetical protein